NAHRDSTRVRAAGRPLAGSFSVTPDLRADAVLLFQPRQAERIIPPRWLDPFPSHISASTVGSAKGATPQDVRPFQAAGFFDERERFCEGAQAAKDSLLL